MKSNKRLNIEIPEDELQFIYKQAQKKELSVSEYISLCVLAQNSILYLSDLLTQLRRLRYQLNALEGLNENNYRELVALQEKTYKILTDVLHMIQYCQSKSGT